jgi:adenine-specific DNA-methyltransferase
VVGLHPSDQLDRRKARGAFFTPPAIAEFLAEWAVDDDPNSVVMDPTCGESVFLSAAGRRLKAAGATARALNNQVFGVDLEAESVARSQRALRRSGLGATLLAGDFFDVPTPDQLGCPLPEVDAVIGNPPFVRYQEHSGLSRKKSAAAALAQGVPLSGLASSWAATLVHACGFLRPEGRLAMVLPAELLTVGYAEPIRRWLRRRFAAVHLVFFEQLQFADALEKVILVLARGSGGCDAFSVVHVNDADDLARLKLFGPTQFAVAPADIGKWTDLLLPTAQRQVFKRVADEHFVPLGRYGAPELGTVTGANAFFTVSESVRRHWDLQDDQLLAISPPGTKHLKGLSFTRGRWEELRDDDEAVWLLFPDATDRSPGLRRYLRHGERLGVDGAYKCRIREPWWRPPVVSAPDLFFTYMSHRYPRLIRNSARVSFLNSMHGLRLRRDAPPLALAALPLLCLNSMTMLGAEVFGRSYGGGILKMEPREAASLPVPGPSALQAAWQALRPHRTRLGRQLAAGLWTTVVKEVDQALLRDALRLPSDDVLALHEAAESLRERRLGHTAGARE